jgi:pyruvate kinase
MDYEIIATLGPASDQPEIWREMLTAGVTAFRLNTSHLSLPALRNWLDRLSLFNQQQTRCLPVVLDLQGSKWRLGSLSAVQLEPGEIVRLVLAKESQQRDTLPVPHPDFFRAAELSDGEIRINDAKTKLLIHEIGTDEIRARVTTGGVISSNKGITLPSSPYRIERLCDKDSAILQETGGIPFIRYALSFIKDAAELGFFRRELNSQAYLIAKIERGDAVRDLSGIAQASNEVWICRGDLGAEAGLVAMAHLVSEVTAQVKDLPVPVMMAGQVLEHMTAQPEPTRSEVCYLSDSLQNGYSGFVLSDETAIGQYPLDACRAAAAWMLK